MTNGQVIVTKHAYQRLFERLHVPEPVCPRLAQKAWVKGRPNTERAIIRKNKGDYFHLAKDHVVKEMMGRAFIFDPRGGTIKLVTVI